MAMDFKTILVHCDAAPEAGKRLAVAAELAQRNAAHLVGVHARPPLQVSAFFEGGVAMDALFASYDSAARAEADKAKSAFENALRGNQLSHEWRMADGYVDDVLASHARYADLLILGQSNPQAATSTPSDLPESVALSAGRPWLEAHLRTILIATSLASAPELHRNTRSAKRLAFTSSSARCSGGAL
jgi:nucleotide-binding universal stress UspA family protein